MTSTASIDQAISEASKRYDGSKYHTVAERVEMGKAARARVPRRSHAAYEPAPDRPDPIDLLQRQAATRVHDLVPIRYGRMLVSPFTFYRGAALIMASDLSHTPNSGFMVQCCGDAHLSNFGAFASAERRLVFDINDFDETLPGPWEWDVKRLAASLLIAARNNDFKAKIQDEIVQEMVKQYRIAMNTFATMTNLEVWYARAELEAMLPDYVSQFTTRSLKRTKAAIAKARTRDSMTAFKKLTTVVDGRAQIVNQPPLIVPAEQFVSLNRDQIIAYLSDLMGRYGDTLGGDRRVLLEQYQISDFAMKVVGVGSVGTRAFIALMTGRDGDDPLFLQAKEAQASVLEEFVGASAYESHGQRVVVGQRLMQSSSDIFLGWLDGPVGLDGVQRDFYLRQLKDWKASLDADQMVPEGMMLYGRLCGWTLARAHARSGDRIAIASYLGNGDVFDRAIVEFSKAYAAQNELDYRALSDAVESDRITAVYGY